MKKIILTLAVLCCIGKIFGCKNGTANENTDTILPTMMARESCTIPEFKDARNVYLDGKQTEYVLLFRSAGCAERMIREIGDDSAALDDFYTAEGDLGYYYYMCRQRLEATGVKYYETSADKLVICQGDMAIGPHDSCACGVLIVMPSCRFKFVSFTDFLFQAENPEQ